ncbi:MAG: class I SAM-dependent methyltransferase [Candidatus Omnitrophota bacterium]
MVKAAKELGVYRYEVCSDACRMPFSKESFNTVFSNSVIEHIPDLDSLLKEVVFVLKPGGQFMFTVPSDKFGEYLFFSRLFNKIGLKRLAVQYSFKRISLLNHYHLFNLNTWSDKMKSFGLEVVEAKQYISRDMLSIWDFIAAVQFIWCRIVPGVSSLPFKKLFLLPFKYFYNRYEINHRDSGAAVLIVAKKL